MRGRITVPKHEQVYEALRQALESGRYKPGDRLPSEADLVRQYGASRITVGRAMRDLKERGLVERRVGSGTYVKTPFVENALSFGLLIPNLGETSIFEAICQGMASSPLAREHVLVWGGSFEAHRSKEQWALELCDQYIARRVSGVFFAPLELSADKDAVNQKVARALDRAGIPVVLLDRTVVAYPQRGHHDLVGIDNRRAGYVISDHLLRQGRRRIAFVALPHAAPTVDARAAGYREALFAWNVPIDRASVYRINPMEVGEVGAMMASCRPEAIVCANDSTAAHLMQTLLRLGYTIPCDVALVGIDDLPFADLLPVPLTTLRQPKRQIGEAAMAVMLQRIAQRDLPTRDILLQCELVVRQSCGMG
jgi:GntR family transcriptional regulator, arabinose operon transcriptional repressor